MVNTRLLGRRVTEQLHPIVERIRADAQPPGYLPNRISSHCNLMHRVALERVAVVACPNVGLLASKLGGKASTNPGAAQHSTSLQIYLKTNILLRIAA